MAESALLKRLLRLPLGNPPLPAGDPASVQTWNPGPAYLRYRLLGYAIALLPTLGLAAGLAAGAAGLAVAPDVPPAARILGVGFLGLGALWVALGALFGAVRIRLEMDMLRYTLTDQALRLRRGVVTVEEVTLSFANIQNVQLSQGPIQRVFGIADLVVETAGGGGPGAHTGHVGLITGVSQPEALRELLLERAKRFQGSGLGGAARPRASGLASPEEAALLAEIRDLLRAAREAAEGRG